MAGHGAALVFDLIARGNAPAEFIRLAGAADKAAAATARAQTGVATSSARMASAGAKLTKGLTLPLLAIGAVSVAQASKFQKSMTLIQTAGGETAAKTAVISDGLKKLAVDTGSSLDSLGEGIYTIAKAGAQKWSAVDQLKVMKAAAQGAKAENVSLGVATDALSTVMLDYHVAAGKAVSTEDELIRASGLAKTNFSEFSTSLSNVTPIAAALGVSFAEVGGAIATMTQHGVSAQQATENLRNLLFNLSGQNNVASQAMQQLGIDTVDLSKNLGSRGLSGTLAIVDRALASHTKHGMVVIDVHKAAALASRSLGEMLGTTTGQLRAQSKGLLDGRVSIKDYTAYAKSLGGESGAAALQFKALYLNSLGFSNQLRSGKGTITTSTAQYAKLLGGMTGASVAMQIGGKYAKENARNVREVGKAALDAGSDVLGWDKTQGTLAVKLDKARASLQVMAVEIGDALIPAVSKLVGWVSKGVHWFSGLSDGSRKFLGVAALVALAVGPILSIFGRLVAFQTRVQGALARTGLVARESAAQFAAAEELKARAAAASTTAIVGAETRQAAAARGAGAAGMVGGRRGFMRGGGGLALGLAGGLGLQYAGSKVGGRTGAGLSDAGTGVMLGSFLGPEGALVGGLLGGAYGATDKGPLFKTAIDKIVAPFKAAAARAAEAKREAQAFKKDYSDALALFTDAELQSGKHRSGASRSIAAQATSDPALVKAATTAGFTQKDLTNAVTGTKMQYQQVLSVMKEMGPAFAKQATYLTQLRRGYVDSSAAARRQALESGHVLAQYNRTTTATKLLTDAHFRVGAATKNAAGTARAFNRALQSVTDSAATNGKTLDRDTSFGQANALAIHKAAQASLRHAQAVTARSGSVKRGVEVLESDRKKLIETATQSGLSAAAAKDLADEVMGVPKTWKSKITVNTDAAKTNLDKLLSEIDTIISRVANARPVLKVATSVEDLPPMLIGSDNGTPGVTTGSFSHPRMIFDESNPPAAAKATGGGGGSGKAAGKKDAGVPAQSAADNQAQADNRRAARSAADALRELGRNAGASAADLIAAGKDFLAAGRAAGLSKAQLQGLAATQQTINADARARDRVNERLGSAPTPPTAYDRLATAQQNYSGAKSAVRGAYTGSFDITQAGGNAYGEPVTFGAIKRQLDKAVANAKKFTQALRRLQKEGLGSYLIEQLAEAGPAALPQALALLHATPKQLKSLSYEYRSLGRYGSQAGTRVADDMYGAGVKSAQGLVNGLLSQQSALNGAIRQLADGMVSTLRSELDMHSPSRRLFNEGALAFEGYRQGIESKYAGIEGAANGAAGKSIPGRGGSSQVGGPAINELHLHYSHPDDYHRATATAMRAAQSVLR